jgi:predicted metal-dependent phosphoesterase TrpH
MDKERVIFEKPNPRIFRTIGLQSVDMHIHTNHSDGQTSPRNALRRAKRNGIGLAICDHNQISGYLEAEKINDGVLLIPGIEVASKEGIHLLFYFYTKGELKEFYEKHIRAYRTGNPYMAIEKTTEQIIYHSLDYNCLRCAAHPFGYFISSAGLQKSIDRAYVDKLLMDTIDTIEVICGAMPRRQNKKALDLAQQSGKFMTGGSDSHSLLEIGRVLTSSFTGTREEFLDSIRKHRNFVFGRETRVHGKAASGINMLPRHIPYLRSSLQTGYTLHLKRPIKRARDNIRRIMNKNH